MEAAGFADTFCSAALMLLSMLILAVTVLIISVRANVVSHLSFSVSIADISAVVTMSVHNCAAAGAAAAAVFRKLSSDSTRGVA